MSTTERKYAMTRIATGDYLLPSNDARTIWRIERYTDGPSLGLDWPRVWRGVALDGRPRLRGRLARMPAMGGGRNHYRDPP